MALSSGVVRITRAGSGGRRRQPAVTSALLLVVALISAGSVLLGTPTRAYAASGSVALGFAEPYGTDSRLHSGIDLLCSAGQQVRSPVAGSVTFAGYIPTLSRDRVLAATVQQANGSLVTVSPLRSLSVVKGQVLEAGTGLGEVAAGGDMSSAATHVHLSLRYDAHYVDPSGLVALLFEPVPHSEEGQSGAPAQSTTHAQATPSPASAQLVSAAMSHPATTMVQTPGYSWRPAGADARLQLSREVRSTLAGATVAPSAMGVVGHADSEVPTHVANRSQVALAIFVVGVLSSAAGAGVVGAARARARSNRFVRAFAVRGNR